jgi:hypothetical protein
MSVEPQSNPDNKAGNPDNVAENEHACKTSPPVSAVNDSRQEADSTHGVQSFTLTWDGELHSGDCSMNGMSLTLRSDGTATFFAFVSTDDDDDQWVFFGGISLLDEHGAELWRSPKLIGPNMPETGATSWFQDFAYPALWFDPTQSARINNAHC